MNTFICTPYAESTSVRAGGCRYVKAWIQRAYGGILLRHRKNTVYKAQPVPAPDTPRKRKAKAHLSCSTESPSERGIRWTLPHRCSASFSLLGQLRFCSPCSSPSLHVDLLTILRTLRWLLIAQHCTFLGTA